MKNGCWNCTKFDGYRCHKNWNNNDDCFYIDYRDYKRHDDICDDWTRDETVSEEEYESCMS